MKSAAVRLMFPGDNRFRITWGSSSSLVTFMVPSALRVGDCEADRSEVRDRFRLLWFAFGWLEFSFMEKGEGGGGVGESGRL